MVGRYEIEFSERGEADFFELIGIWKKDGLI